MSAAAWGAGTAATVLGAALASAAGGGSTGGGRGARGSRTRQTFMASITDLPCLAGRTAAKRRGTLYSLDRLTCRSGGLPGWLSFGNGRTACNPWLLHRSGRLPGRFRPGLADAGCSARLLHSRTVGPLGCDLPRSTTIESSVVATRIGTRAEVPGHTAGQPPEYGKRLPADEPGHASTSPGRRFPWSRDSRTCSCRCDY